MALVWRARGGGAYELKFATAFSDAEGVALIGAAVIGAALVAGVRWAAALLAMFAVLVVGGVVHPCRIAFQDTPQPNGCSVSAAATALGLYAPLAAVACAIAHSLAARVALSRAMSAALLGGAAIVVLLSLWLPWYGASDEGRAYDQTGWQAFQRFDVYLVVVAAAAATLAAAIARRPRSDRLGAAVALLAASGAGIAFYRLFTAADPPSSGYTPLPAAVVALAALVAMALAACASGRATTAATA